MDLSQKLCIKRIKLVINSCLGLVGLILASIAMAQWLSAESDFHEIVSNWNQSPIDSMTLVGPLQDCPVGYAELEPDYPDFPGTREFCDCTGVPSPFNNGQHSGRFKGPYGPKGICWLNETNAGCDEVSSTSGHRVYWFDRKLCYRRWPSKDTGINRPRVFGNETCPEGYYRCGPTNQFSEEEEFVCAPSGFLCPIKEYSRVPTSEHHLYQECWNDTNWQIGFSLCWNRINDTFLSEQPMVKSRSYPDRPCRPDGVSKSFGRGWNDWRKGSSYSCDKSDSRWTLTLSRDERAFYQEVSKPVPDLATRCPKCQGSTSEVTVIASRQEIYWRPDCILTRQDIADMSSRVTKLTDTQIAVLVFTVFNFIILSCLYNGWEFVQNDSPSWKDDTLDQLRVRVVRIGFSVFMSLIKIIPITIALVTSRSLRSDFARLGDQVCTTEDQTASTLRFLNHATHDQADINVNILIFCCMEIFMEFIHGFLGWKELHDFSFRKYFKKKCCCPKETSRRDEPDPCLTMGHI